MSLIEITNAERDMLGVAIGSFRTYQDTESFSHVVVGSGSDDKTKTYSLDQVNELMDGLIAKLFPELQDHHVRSK